MALSMGSGVSIAGDEASSRSLAAKLLRARDAECLAAWLRAWQRSVPVKRNMGRTVIVGDVHGCADELDALLDRVAFASTDRLVLAGDLVARGPDSSRVCEIARRCTAVVVRGNHEEKLVVWRARMHANMKGLGKRPEPLGRVHERVASSLRAAEWALLAGAPVSWDLPEHGLRVVHAGVVPGIPFDAQDRETLLRIRTVGGPGFEGNGLRGKMGEERLWGELYEGAPHVVFGHNARRDPQLHPWATGLDTACVYGGRLTALVLRSGERMPRGLAARALLVSVVARRVYVGESRRADERERRVA